MPQLSGLASCEVVYQQCMDHTAHSLLWSPDAESLAMLSHSIGAGREQRHLVLRHHISRGCQVHHLELPFASLVLPCNVAFSPSSKHVLALDRGEGPARQAAFVDTATAAVQLQPEAVPAVGLCVGVTCGSAGYVAAACVHGQGGSVSVLLAAGSPIRLQLLHQIPTWKVVTRVNFADSGLLCCWAEIDTVGPEGTMIARAEDHCLDVQGPARAMCCKAASGRCTIIARQRLCQALWRSLITQVCEGMTAAFEPGFGLDGTSSMLISGPEELDRHPVPAGQQPGPNPSLARHTFGS